MPDPASNGRVARFGLFRFQLGTGELCKNGSRRTLSGQPLQVLSALLEKPGEVVTREALRRRLWPEDAFVDFDHSLRVATNRLREVLGDSADSPRFIETVRGRGLRFIVPVTWEKDNGATLHEIEASNGVPLWEMGGIRDVSRLHTLVRPC